MNLEDYNEYYIQGSDHYLIPKDVFKELFNEMVNWKEESQKQKEVIDKINNYIDNYDIFKVFSFPLMKRWEEEQVKSSIDYEFKSSLIKDLKDILKEVSE